MEKRWIRCGIYCRTYLLKLFVRTFHLRKDVPLISFAQNGLIKKPKNLLQKKKQAYKIFKRSESPQDYQSYVIAQRESKKTIKTKKPQFQMKIANKSKENPTEFYSYIRDKKL